MITDTVESNQLSITSDEVFKLNFKICQKDGCEEACIPKGKYCEEHRTNKNKICKYDKCKKISNFNFEGYKNSIFCNDHKKNGMIDVRHKICNYAECNKHPLYNFEGETNGLFCKDHKKNGMINIVDKKCTFTNCNTRPSYNYKEKSKGLYCFEHSLNGMINVESKKCNKKECLKQPNFNFKGKTNGLFCFTHKEPGMINVVDKTCKSEWCDTQVKNKYEGYCVYCFVNKFPNSPLVRNYKTKEKSVVDFITESFEDYEWINDKTIDGGCSKKRPDMMLDFGSHIIIIEIDEDAHSNYDCSCENKRLMEISQDLGHRPIVFIRFNPDSYTDKEGKKIKSCWSINKTSGLLYINNKKQWKERLECLKKQVEYWIEYETDKTIEIVQLFFT